MVALLVASVGLGAAPASADPWVPAGPTVALSVQTRSWVPAGTPFAVTVTARDAEGAVATSYRGTVSFTSSDRRAPVLPDHYTFTEADAGVRTFHGVELHHAAEQTVAVADRADHWLSGAATVRVTAGPLAALGVWASPRATAGVGFDVRVAPVDAWRNWVLSYRGTVRFGSDDPLVRSLPPDRTFTAADRGSVVVPGVTLVTPGRFRVTATDTARPEITGSAPVRVADAGAAVEGQVLAGMDPLDGATVTVYDAVTGHVLRSVTLDERSHRYRVEGLPAGGVRLGATHPGPYAPDFANNRDTLAEADVFTLTPGATRVQGWGPDDFGPYLDLQELGG